MLDRGFFADEVEHVSELQAQVWEGGENHVLAADAADVDSEALVDACGGNGFADDVAVCDDHAFGCQGAGGFSQILVNSAANAQLDAVKLLGRADGEDDVADLQNGVAGGDFRVGFGLAADSRDDHVFIAETGDIADGLASEI